MIDEPKANKCEWCEATANKRTREPFTLSTLNGHRIRCPKRPSSTVENPQSKAKPLFDSRTPIKSTSSTVEDPTHTLSLREKREAQSPSEAAAVQEEESVATLWKKYKFDRRENGRQVFTPTDHLYMGVPYNRATVKQKAQRTGVIAKLLAHAHQAAFDEIQAAAEKAQRDNDPAHQRMLALSVEWAAERKERAARQAAWETELAAQEPVVEVYADTDPFFPPRKDPTAPMDFNNLNERVLAQIVREKREKERKANGTRNR